MLLNCNLYILLMSLQEEDDPDAVYGAQPFWQDRTNLTPGFDSDIEKGDGDSGSSGSGLDGDSITIVQLASIGLQASFRLARTCLKHTI